MGILKSVTSPEIIAQKKKLSEIATAINNKRLEEEQVTKSIKAAKNELNDVLEAKVQLITERAKEGDSLEKCKYKTKEAQVKLNVVLNNISDANNELSTVNKKIGNKQKELKRLEDSYNVYVCSIESAKQDMKEVFLTKSQQIEELMS